VGVAEPFMTVSDFHGDRHDPVARKGSLVFKADWKPVVTLLAGDLWDFRALRSGASKEEKLHSMMSDFETGMEYLEELRPDVFLLGNHDQRLWDAIEYDGLKKSGPICDLAKILVGRFEKVAKALKLKVLPYDKKEGVWRRNGLAVVHGFDGMDPENMASMYGNVLYGHGHCITRGAAPHQESEIVARQIGSLCLKGMRYNRGQTRTLRQQHGWAYGVFMGRNRHAVQQVELIDGQFSYAATLKTVTVA
jgi:hypothetical protein